MTFAPNERSASRLPARNSPQVAEVVERPSVDASVLAQLALIEFPAYQPMRLWDECGKIREVAAVVTRW